VFVRLDWKNLTNDKHSSLLQKFVIYGQKSFITLISGVSVIKLFVFVIDGEELKARAFVGAANFSRQSNIPYFNTDVGQNKLVCLSIISLSNLK
jgi:hypothetical protein